MYPPVKHKKYACLFFVCVIFSAFILSSFSAFAAENETPLSVSAKSAILIEQTTGKVIYQKDADVKLAPASITKTMTMLLTIEAIEKGEITLDDMVTASENACGMGGTEIWLEKGEQMSVKDLLKALAVSSANDAAVALAEYVGGDEKSFVALMNQRAQELGCKNTVFKNSHGLDEEGHVSSAYDIAVISAELMSYELTKEFTTIWMDSLRNGDTQLVNTNRLIRFYDGATGVKTGTTDNAGYCVSASAEKNGLSLIAVVMGCNDNDSRFNDAKALLDYGFKNYTFAPIPELEELPEPIPVKYGQIQSVEPVPAPPEGILINNSLKGTLTAVFEAASELEAPVLKGQDVGTVSVMSSDEVLLTFPLKAKEEVKRMTVPHALAMFLKSVISL